MFIIENVKEAVPVYIYCSLVFILRRCGNSRGCNQLGLQRSDAQINWHQVGSQVPVLSESSSFFSVPRVPHLDKFFKRSSCTVCVFFMCCRLVSGIIGTVKCSLITWNLFSKKTSCILDLYVKFLIHSTHGLKYKIYSYTVITVRYEFSNCR
jgi:hypothetical protein